MNYENKLGYALTKCLRSQRQLCQGGNLALVSVLNYENSTRKFLGKSLRTLFGEHNIQVK